MVKFNCSFVSESGTMADIIIQQGTDGGWRWPVNDANGAPANTEGWTVKAEVRSSHTGQVVHTWSTALGNAIVEPGFVTIIWTSTDSEEWTWNEGKYDLEATFVEGSDTKVVRLDKGYVSVSGDITK